MALPNGFMPPDTEDDNILDPSSVRTVADCIKDFIKLIYKKTLDKQESENTSDDVAPLQELGISDVITGTALFGGYPSEVGVTGVLQDMNYYYEIPFSAFDNSNYFGNPVFIGATNHLYDFGHQYYTAVENAINQNYIGISYGLDNSVINSINTTDYRCVLDSDGQGNTYGYLEYYSGSGGTISRTINAFLNQYNSGGTTYTRNARPLILSYTGRYFSVSNVNNENRLSVMGSGGFTTLGSDRIYLELNSSNNMIVSSDNTITNNYINNVDNTNQYNNTYTYEYDGDTYNIEYGDNYIVVNTPSDPLSFDDWRMILLPVIDDLNQNSNLDTDIQFPSYTEIKYGDYSEFYIEPLHQYDKLPVAPSFDGSISFGDIPKFVGESANSYLGLLGTGLSSLLCGCFITAFIVKKMGR